MAVWPLGGSFLGPDCPKCPFLGPKVLFLAQNNFFCKSSNFFLTIMTRYQRDSVLVLLMMGIAHWASSRGGCKGPFCPKVSFVHNMRHQNSWVYFDNSDSFMSIKSYLLFQKKTLKINIIIFLMKALLKMSGIYKVVPWRVNLVAAAAAKKWTLALFVIQLS